MHRPHVGQVAPQRIENLAFARDARHQDVIARHPRGDAVEHGVAAHADAVGDEYVLRAAIGGIARELAERAFRLVHAGEDLAFDDDLGAGGHFQILHAAAGHPIGLAEETADDLEFSHLRRIGVDHRAHVMQRVDPERDDCGQRFAALLGAAVELVEPPARMQGDAEAVFALEHQTVEAGGVDAAHGIARDDLPGGDVGRRVHRELQRDRQLGEVDVVALDHDVLPRAARHGFARDVFLAALAKRGGQIAGLDPETGGQQLAIAGDIGDERHAAARTFSNTMTGLFPA